MTRVNENRSGYKRTKVGWIPNDWIVSKLGEVSSYINGRGFKPHEWSRQGLPIIRIQNLNGSTEYNYYEGDYDPKILVEKGELLFAWSGSRGTSFGPHFWRLNKGLLNYHTWKVIAFSNIDKTFLYYTLLRLTKKIEDDAHGQAALVHIQKQFITDYIFPLPPMKEQKKIAEILSTWDNGIEKLEKLIELKEQRKKGFMQQLIDSNCFKWKHYRVDEIFNTISEKNNDDEELLSVTQDRGVIPRTFLEGKVMSPEGNTNSYKLVRPGDFVVSLRSFQGGIEYSNYQGIISPAYTVLRPKKSISTSFYKYFFKSYIFIRKYLSIAVIGIRDGKQISMPHFSSVKIPLPEVDEQKRIADVMEHTDKELTKAKALVQKIETQKKGLMQKLLTGEVRVKTEQQETADVK